MSRYTDKFLDLYALLFVAATAAAAQVRMGDFLKAEVTLKDALAAGWRAAGTDQERLLGRIRDVDEKILDNWKLR